MWASRTEKLTQHRGLRVTISRHSQSATFAEVFQGWREDAGFRVLFNSLLADSSYSAFRWETPGVTTATLSQPFECVVLDSPELARSPDPDAFAEHFTQAEAGVAVFPNLGGNAIMIVPTPLAKVAVYTHLADFVRHAPEVQRHALWQSIGETIALRIGAEPVWLNTAGAGVAWLHVRLDNRPKYYHYKPYKHQNIGD